VTPGRIYQEIVIDLVHCELDLTDSEREQDPISCGMRKERDTDRILVKKLEGKDTWKT
jgi:hypothetical protein